MIPELNSRELKALMSTAESKLYSCLHEQLDADILVLHSQCFIRETNNKARIDGEADFVIFDQDFGVVVIEVKGGGISFDPQYRTWNSIDKNGEKHIIKDPFLQAKNEKFAILKTLSEDEEWSKLNLNISRGHAVFFPDVDNISSLVKPDSPIEIIGGRIHLADINYWYKTLKKYWSGNKERYDRPINLRGMKVIERLFLTQIFVMPLIVKTLQDEEIERITLTNQQAQLLRALRNRKKAGICGGAGTGKTLLAIEKARALAEEGLNTLLLCYNRPLSDHLQRIIGEVQNLFVMNFHQFCTRCLFEFKKATGRDLLMEAEFDFPGEDKFDVLYPFALTVAQEERPILFDAIIIDEGQDFADEYWLPITVSLNDDKDSVLYIFFDYNQNLYTKSKYFPIELEDIYFLSNNCRNTRQIHNLISKFFNGYDFFPPLLTVLQFNKYMDIHYLLKRNEFML
ncbi:MAG: NERD domain-containing protein [Desulfamplus sp.]|nr:NERD domain-containing protein [Desulfamplus sp.]